MARSIGRFAGERVALGAREVDDDLGLVFEFGMEFVLDGGEGAEEQVAGVGHDGGAAGVDFVPGLEFIEFAEGAVDNDRERNSSASPLREAARSAWSRSFWCSAACLEQRPDSGSAMGRRQNRWLGKRC